MVIEYVMDIIENAGLTVYKNLPQLSDAVCHTLVINDHGTAIQQFNPDDYASPLDSKPLDESESIAVIPSLMTNTASQLKIVNVPNVKFIDGFTEDWDGVTETQKYLDERDLVVGFYLTEAQRAALNEIRELLEPSDSKDGFSNHSHLPKSYYFYAPVAQISATPITSEECAIKLVLAEVEILSEGFSVSFLDRNMEDGWFKITQPSLTV